MGYIENALKRVTIQDLRSFILTGAEEINKHSETFEERLENATASMYIRLRNLYSDSEEQQDAVNDFNYVLSVYEDVYTEIGMQLGAKLIFELLPIFKTPYESQ